MSVSRRRFAVNDHDIGAISDRLSGHGKAAVNFVARRRAQSFTAAAPRHNAHCLKQASHRLHGRFMPAP